MSDPGLFSVGNLMEALWIWAAAMIIVAFCRTVLDPLFDELMRKK